MNQNRLWSIMSTTIDDTNRILEWGIVAEFYLCFTSDSSPSLSDRDVCHIEKTRPPPTSHALTFLPSHPWTVEVFFPLAYFIFQVLPSSPSGLEPNRNPQSCCLFLPLFPHLLIQKPSLSSSLSSPSFSFSPLILLFLSPPPLHCLYLTLS